MVGLEASLDLAAAVALVLVVIGLAAASWRLIAGPSSADRVVALEFISVGLVAIAALMAIQSENTAYLDFGIPVALAGFLAAVALARLIERRTAREHAKGSCSPPSDRRPYDAKPSRLGGRQAERRPRGSV